MGYKGGPTVSMNENMQKCEVAEYKLGKELFFYIPLIYGIPTVFLYVNIAIVIIMKSSNPFLRLAFLRIYAVYALIVVVMWFFDMSTTRFLGIGYFCKELLFSWGTPSWEISIVQFIMTYSRHAQFYAATVLSINRMTAVLVPVAYNESSVTFTTLFVALICAFTILICSAITYFKLTCRRNRFRCTKVDRVLLVVGLTSSLTTFTLALVEVPLYITINFGTLSRDHFFIATCIKQCVIDLTFVFSAWSTIYQCSTIRSTIIKLYFPSRVKAQGISLATTNTTTTRLLTK
ncbi:unnamed protein product [Cylicocyclus nassatus]|uniref:Serpentine receptor class gamma n=1 Tax=Cylicocyclus nassatus TaxID=53992 RepID=A0AA36H6I7_CYLNA|nr:unnamed protein product [Cylicocyclus nassatus]